MQINIERTMHLDKFLYTIRENVHLTGEANYTFGFRLLKMFAENNSGLRLEFVQTNAFLKLLNGLPLLNMETIVPFSYLENMRVCGYSKKSLFKPVFSFFINEDNYELRQHQNNMCSLMYNDRQVALYVKDYFTTAEKNHYVVYYDEYMNGQEILLIFLFCIFIDMVFFPNACRLSLFKYEKDFVFKDKFPERTLWRPGNE